MRQSVCHCLPETLGESLKRHASCKSSKQRSTTRITKHRPEQLNMIIWAAEIRFWNQNCVLPVVIQSWKVDASFIKCWQELLLYKMWIHFYGVVFIIMISLTLYEILSTTHIWMSLRLILVILKKIHSGMWYKLN